MIEFHQVCKQYGRRPPVLTDISFTVQKGELAYLAGASGAGKSTLLKMIAGMEQPTSGAVRIAGQDISRLKSSALPYLRRKLGLILQEQRLLQDRSVLANVMLPMLVTGTRRADADKRGRAALEKVGLLDKVDSEPAGLSGGEQQRVAVARAIVNRPQIILADEPTANLDRHSAARVFHAIRAFQDAGVTCIIATHDESILRTAQRVIYLNHGRLISGEQEAFAEESVQS